MITVVRAREILGAEAAMLSDDEVARQCREIADLARFLLKRLRREDQDRAAAIEERIPA